MKNLKASVIIITKNQKPLLQKSLPILLQQQLSGGYEIIVVDSGSTDGAREYIKGLPVVLVETKPKTFVFAKAFNIGAKKAKGEYLVRLSGDVIPKRKDFLDQILLPFQNPHIGGTYGKYTQGKRKGVTHPSFWPPSRFPPRLTRYTVKPNLIKLIMDQEHLDLVTNFAGGCCAIRKSQWQQRPFNDKLIAGEDAEYAIYLHLKGLDIMCNPQAEVIHEHEIQNLKENFYNELKWRILLSKEIVKLLLRKY